MDFPLPPPELAARVMGCVTEPAGFLASGEQTAKEWQRSLTSVGVDLASAERLLDWGCGPARVTRWLAELAPQAEIHGVDIDHQSIEWAQESLPFATFHHVDPKPPLPFEDGYFDLVVNHSVLTHLDEEMQDLWLEELMRVTAPEGTVMLTVHGDHAFAKLEESHRAGGFDPSPMVATLRERGIVYLTDDWWTGGPYPDFYHTSYHTPWYVFEHWSSFFEIRAYLARADGDYQDVVLLRRRDEHAPRPIVRAARKPAAADTRVQAVDRAGAFTRASALIDARGSVDSPTRYGSLGRAARRAVQRLTRHSTRQQDDIDRALLASIAEVRESVVTHADAAGARELFNEIVNRQGDRVGRLEDRVSGVEKETRRPMSGNQLEGRATTT
jgi:SAM-dependent methyltransferase